MALTAVFFAGVLLYYGLFGKASDFPDPSMRQWAVVVGAVIGVIALIAETADEMHKRRVDAETRRLKIEKE